MSAFSPSPRFEFQAWRHAVPTAIRLARRMLETRLLLILFWPYQEPPETDAYNVDGVLNANVADGNKKRRRKFVAPGSRTCDRLRFKEFVTQVDGAQCAVEAAS